MHPETCPAGAGGMSGGKPRWEVADVFRRYGDDYRRAHRLSVAQRKVMRAIEACRTERLGGHVERCDACGYARNAYNSCRNRHCRTPLQINHKVFQSVFKIAFPHASLQIFFSCNCIFLI